MSMLLPACLLPEPLPAGLLCDHRRCWGSRARPRCCTQVGHLPEVYSELEVNFFLLRRLLGVRSKDGEKQSKVCGLLGESRGLGRTSCLGSLGG